MDPIARGDAGVINGVVKNSSTGEAIAGALVMLQCACLPAMQEFPTTQRGVYSFNELPAGKYTIQVVTGNAHAAKFTELSKGAEFRADFVVDPEG